MAKPCGLLLTPMLICYILLVLMLLLLLLGQNLSSGETRAGRDHVLETEEGRRARANLSPPPPPPPERSTRRRERDPGLDASSAMQRAEQRWALVHRMLPLPKSADTYRHASAQPHAKSKTMGKESHNGQAPKASNLERKEQLRLWPRRAENLAYVILYSVGKKTHNVPASLSSG